MYVLKPPAPDSDREVGIEGEAELTGPEGDVGGQKTLRSYWRNYFEKTDALIWVVDATDRGRVRDCKEELHGLLMEEVSLSFVSTLPPLCHPRRLHQWGPLNSLYRYSSAS